MKKIVVFFMILLMCLGSSCMRAESGFLADDCFDTSKRLEEYDTENEHCLPGVIMCKTESVYYGKPFFSSYISYLDRKNNTSGILCSKPECMHDNVECNAFVGSGTNGLSLYDGHLYWVGTDPLDTETVNLYLWRMNLDGTDRERVQQLHNVEVNNNVLYQIHRGYVYVAGVIEEIEDGVASERVLVTAEKIGEEGKRVIVLDKKYPMPTPFCRLQIVGNQVYVMISSSDMELSSYLLELYEWDSKTRELKILVQDRNVPFFGWSMWVEKNEGIYISNYARREGECCQLYKYDFQNQEISLCYEFENSLYSMAEVSDNIVVAQRKDENNITTVLVQDFSGNTLYDQEIIFDGMGNDKNYRCFFGGNQERLFYCMMSLGETTEKDAFIIEIPLSADGKISVFSVKGNE